QGKKNCCWRSIGVILYFFFFFQAEDGIRDLYVTGVQTCALPISINRLDPLPDIAGDHRDIGQRIEPIDRIDGTRQEGRGIDRAESGRRPRRLPRFDDVRIRQLGNNHRRFAPISRRAQSRDLPDSTNTPCSAKRLASPPRGSRENGRPCRSSVMLRSILVPSASHSTTKSRIVQRWILGVSYHELFSSSDTGMRPR